MSEVAFVRLRPYNRLLGDVRIDCVAPWGAKYKAGDWHEIPLDSEEQMAAVEFLRSERQHVNNPDSRPAFDICTREQARAMIEMERSGKLQKLFKDVEEKPVPPKSIASAPSVEMNREKIAHELEAAPPAPPPPVQPPAPKAVTSKPKQTGRPVASRPAAKKRTTRRRPKK